jgi:hypothetical protein
MDEILDRRRLCRAARIASFRRSWIGHPQILEEDPDDHAWSNIPLRLKWRDGALDGSSLFMRDASPQAVDAREIDSP